MMNAMKGVTLNNRKAVFTYGRFDNVNNVNKQLIVAMVNRSKETSADPYIVVTHTGSGANAKRVKLENMFPGIPIMSTSSTNPSVVSIIDRLRNNKKYRNIEMVTRTNSVGQFKKFINIPIFNSGVVRTTAKKTPAATKKARPALKKTKLGTRKPATSYNRKFKKSGRNVRALSKMMKNLF